MSLRVLCLGDAHFKTNNVIEVDIFLKKLQEYLDAHRDEIDLIINLGDTLDEHSRLHVTPLNKAIKYVKLLASYKPTYVIVGNHDAENNSIYLDDNHWLNCLKAWPNIEVVDTVTIATINNVKIALTPYVPDGRLIEALNTRKGDWEDSRCIFTHNTIRGAQMGSMIAKDADEWDPSWPMLVSGHIHLSQWLGPNMYYTGSILQVAVDENPHKHIVMVTVPPEASNGVNIKEIDLHLPKKEIVHISMEELEEYKVPSEPDTKYILYVSGDYDDFKTFIKSALYKSLIKLPQIYRGSKGIKFKPKKIALKESIAKLKSIKECKLKHFNDLLIESIEQDNDPLLRSFYRHLVHEDSEDLSNMLNDVLVLTTN
jgi:DNA repair exonuclease SbcCD nuclease subunit